MEYVQNDIFSELYPKFVIDKPIRLIELFAGIGSQAKALKNLGVCFEHWKVVEFDKYAIKSYNAVHGTNFETSDIREAHAADLDLRERERMAVEIRTDATRNASQISPELSVDYRRYTIKFI